MVEDTVNAVLRNILTQDLINNLARYKLESRLEELGHACSFVLVVDGGSRGKLLRKIV